MHVSTTAGCWTAYRGSYLGMTVHWLEDDLVRRSACLAVRRVTGSHTYNIIAKLIESIHIEFKIAANVNCTITDNGSNFVKTFRIYQPEDQISNMGLSDSCNGIH